MYIENKDAKEITAESVKAVLVKMAQSRGLSVKLQKEASAPFTAGAGDDGYGGETGHLDRLAADLAALNNAIVKQVKETEGYCRDAVRCICSKEPRGNLDTGRHYYNVYYIGKGGGIEMLKIPHGKVTRAVMGLSARDGIDTGFFSSGAIGMSRQLDATDIIFNILKEAGGVYAQF